MKELPDVYVIRRQNLRNLRDTFGSFWILHRLVMAKQQLSRYIGRNPTLNIGDEIARRIEREFMLQRGWMDHIHKTGPKKPKTIEERVGQRIADTLRPAEEKAPET